jgi:hypothetical protein
LWLGIKYKNLVLSRKPIDQEWIDDMYSIHKMLQQWKSEYDRLEVQPPKLKRKFFITSTLYFDWIVNIHGLIELAKKSLSLNIPFIPGKINQDSVENWFILQRGCGGFSNPLTVADYRKNSGSLRTYFDIPQNSNMTNKKEEMKDIPRQSLKRRKSKRKKTNLQNTHDFDTIKYSEEGNFRLESLT